LIIATAAEPRRRHFDEHLSKMSVTQGVPASALAQRSEQQHRQLLGPYASETVSANQEDAVTANVQLG
jgi:hypothetical protein